MTEKDKKDAQNEESSVSREEEEEGSEPWTLIERRLEKLQEGAKKIIQGIENLKTELKNVSKTLEEKK